MGAADLHRRPLAVKVLYVAIVPANACQRTKFQLSSSISLRHRIGQQYTTLFHHKYGMVVEKQAINNLTKKIHLTIIHVL